MKCWKNLEKDMTYKLILWLYKLHLRLKACYLDI